MFKRTKICTGVLLAMSVLAAPAYAQTTDRIEITGSRIKRIAGEGPLPVEVITRAEIEKRGVTSTNDLLRSLSYMSSFNDELISNSPNTTGSASAGFRGLSGDQTVVLLNGRRMAPYARADDGQKTFTDISTIPMDAVDRIEILKDGASSIYGADAIAGVINLRLREADSGGGITATYGLYDTDYTTARGSHSRRDGEQVSLAGWVGLPLFGDGFLTLSGEVQKREPTNRSDFAAPGSVNGGSATTVLGRFGDPYTEAGSIWFNAGKPMQADWSS